MRLIMFAEGTDLRVKQGVLPYAVRFNYTEPHITNFLKRAPAVPFNGKDITAQGAYQIVKGTWEMCVKALGLKDFSPSSQDSAALYLIKLRGAENDVLNGNWIEAIKKCSREWASLPFQNDTSYYNYNGKEYHIFGGTPQPAKKLSTLLEFLKADHLLPTKDNSIISANWLIPLGIVAALNYKTIKNAISF
ncbi:MAG: hypothetical protein JNL75_11150 [Chitinophagales bacterium]|nr:hypothetical protein [Chitinophagales bacterium]